MKGVDFAALSCVPVLKSGESSTRVADVLYVPDLRLQLIEGRRVPREAVPEEWTLQFEVGRDFNGYSGRYEVEFKVVQSDRDVCILSNFYSRNFLHWITEELPKVVRLEREGFHGAYVMANLPSFAEASLVMLGITAERIMHVDLPTQFASAYYVPAVHSWNILEHQDTVRAVRDSMLRAAGQRRAGDRIWMERSQGVNNPGRDLLNRDDVYALLQKYGFDTIDMAAMSLPDQVATAHQATALAGPHGAGFVHALFQRPGSTVVECFSPNFINPGAIDICRLMRHRYSMIVASNAYGSYPFGDQLKIDCSQLDLALQQTG